MLLSIIVPVFNVEQYLDRCIESIVNQTYQNIEIILIDDGSTDLSGDLCDKWAEIDKRIIVIHKENGGLSSARNVGIKIANGDYLGFVDSDDFIDINMYREMMDAAIEQRKDIACCGRIVDLGKSEKQEFCNESMEIFDTKTAIREVLLLNKMDVSACDKIYRKHLFNKVFYPEGIISEDAAIIFRILHTSNGVVHTGKPYYHYVFREQSISKSKYTHKKYDAYLNCITIRDFINQNYPCLKKECDIYCSFVTGALLMAMYKKREYLRIYKADYKEYRRLFCNGFWEMLVQRSIQLKVKIKFLLVYMHLYSVFLKIKQKSFFDMDS